MDELLLLEKAIQSYESNNNLEDSLRIFKKLAKKGNLVAQICYARHFWNGEASEDWDEAIYWFTKAAERGHALSQFWLGNSLILGSRNQIDYKRGFFWLKKAAEQNVKMANYHLGLCYYYGLGVDVNKELAIQNIVEAGNAKVVEADLFLAEYYRSNKEQYKKIIDKMNDVYRDRMTIEQEVALNLADAYMRGYGVTKDFDKAYQIYSLSILDDNISALLARNKCLEKGLGVTKNLDLAINGYRQLKSISKVANSRYNFLCKLYRSS